MISGTMISTDSLMTKSAVTAKAVVRDGGKSQVDAEGVMRKREGGRGRSLQQVTRIGPLTKSDMETS